MTTISLEQLTTITGGQGPSREATPAELAQDRVAGNYPMTCWDQKSGGAVCIGPQKVNVYGADGVLKAQWDHRYLDTKL